MRETLTVIAAFLVILLAAALAVPPFIDWSSYGASVSARLGKALDAEVALGGPISVRLLPSPRFEVGRIDVRRVGVDLRSEAASLELGLASLMRGVVTVTSAKLDRPRLTIDSRETSANGTVPSNIGIERVELRDASVALVTANGAHRLDHLDVTASADNVMGPYRADGFFRARQRLVPFRLGTGVLADNRLAVKLEIDPLAGLPKAEANGALRSDATGLRFEGAVTLAGDIAGAARDGGAMPWRATIDGSASGDGAHFTAIEARVGDDRTKLVATGDGRVDADGTVITTLRSKRPDFDRLVAAYDPARIVAAIVSDATATPFAVRWSADDAVLGEEIVTGARLAFTRRNTDPADIMMVDAKLSVTRGGEASFQGTTDLQSKLSGNFSVRSDDAPAFVRWSQNIAPASPAFDVPASHVEVSGRIEARAQAATVSALHAVLDRTVLDGNLSVTRSRENVGRIDATLTSSALDLDAVPDLSRVTGWTKGWDFSLALDARAIRVARVGRASLDAGRIALTLARTGDALVLDRLALENVGGATLRATGQASPRAANLDATLDARQIGDFAGLVRRVAPGAWSDAFVSRASLLAPATLDLRLEAAAMPGQALTPTRLTLQGRAADTQLRANLAPDANGVTGSVTFEAPDAVPLLRQIGVPVIPIRGQGGGRIEAQLSGHDGAPFAVTANASIAGAIATFEGTSRFDATALGVNGTLQVKARDLGPLLRIVAAPVDAFAAWPVDAKARIDADSKSVGFADIDGTIAGTRVSGSLTKSGNEPIGGSLNVERLDVARVAALLLGPPQRTSPGRPYPTLKFSPQPNDPPAATVALHADQVALPGDIVARDARATVTLGPGVIAMRDATMALSGGTLAGSATLRRREETASINASLTASGLSAALPWTNAMISGRIAVAGAGTSMTELLASLAGSGSVQAGHGSLSRADPTAPTAVATAVDAERIALEPPLIVAALSRALDSAPQTLSPFEQPITIEAGAVTLKPFTLPIGAGSASLSARYEIANDRVDVRESLIAMPPADWTGPPPRINLAFTGPLASPTRSLDAAELIGTLAAHGLTREEARIAAIDADRRERAFFNRRLRSERAAEAERRAEAARVEAARQEELRQAELARQDAKRKADEAARQEAARQREAERAMRERQSSDSQSPGTAARDDAPLELRSRAVPRTGSVPSIIAPDPSTLGRY